MSTATQQPSMPTSDLAHQRLIHQDTTVPYGVRLFKDERQSTYTVVRGVDVVANLSLQEAYYEYGKAVMRSLGEGMVLARFPRSLAEYELDHRLREHTIKGRTLANVVR